MDDPENTRPQDLLRAADIGRKAGLRYVYAGNLPGNVSSLEDTRCHQCGDTHPAAWLFCAGLPRDSRRAMSVLQRGNSWKVGGEI